jgi:serine O-acetyltransferase
VQIQGQEGRVNAYLLYRAERWFYLRHVPVLPKVIYYTIFLLYNSSIPFTADIGRGTKFGYGGMGVVTHARSRIGQNCLIGQQVTLGGRSHIYEVPVLEDSVYVAAGAKILGNVHVGEGAIIGANAVVIHDVPAHSVAAGVPARIIRENVDVNDYV